MNLKFCFMSKSCCLILYISIFFLLLIGFIAIPAQERNFNISFETRNEAIAAYNKGCKLIDSDKTNEGISYLLKSIRTDSTLFSTYGMLFKASMISENYADSILNYFYDYPQSVLL